MLIKLCERRSFSSTVAVMFECHSNIGKKAIVGSILFSGKRVSNQCVPRCRERTIYIRIVFVPPFFINFVRILMHTSTASDSENDDCHHHILSTCTTIKSEISPKISYGYLNHDTLYNWNGSCIIFFEQILCNIHTHSILIIFQVRGLLLLALFLTLSTKSSIE